MTLRMSNKHVTARFLGQVAAFSAATAAFVLPAGVTSWAATKMVEAGSPDVPSPLSYLTAFGSPGHEIRPILMALIWLSVAVVVIITALVAIGCMRRGRRVEDMSADMASVRRGNDGTALRWIYGGLALTVAILLFFIVWTVDTMAVIQSPDRATAATINVTGHQWWWEVSYEGKDGAVLFETANEMRVPVGHPVKLVLRSADVIHSFWVPLLAGKTDLIPGQENVAWLRADTVGIYRGQCLEYCGLQHANMSFNLVAMPPEEFEAWLKTQEQPPRDEAKVSPNPNGPAATRVPAVAPSDSHNGTR